MTGDILDVAQRLGAKLKRVAATEFAGPCPKCGGRDRFSVNISRQVWNCRRCDKGGDAIELARHIAGLTFPEAREFVTGERADLSRPPAAGRLRVAPQSPPDPAPDAEKAAQALALWRDAVDPRGTVAEVYLNRRGLALDNNIAGRALRWHAGTGAMLGLFRNVATGEPQALSRTFLTPDAKKLSRKFLGPVGGAAIALDEATEFLTVAEGIESAMTARAFGHGPTWACGSAGAIAALPVIPVVKRLRILVERDENGASERAAVACAERWQAAGRAVLLKLPPPRCGDINDAVRQDR